MMPEEQIQPVDAAMCGPAFEVSRFADFDVALQAERGRRGTWGSSSGPSTSDHKVDVRGVYGEVDGDKRRLLRRVVAGLGGEGLVDTGSPGSPSATKASDASGSFRVVEEIRKKMYARYVCRGFMRYGNDVILARHASNRAQGGQGHDQDEERATILARSDAAGYVAVGTSRGNICVISSASGKAEFLDRAEEKKMQGKGVGGSGGSGGRAESELTALTVEEVQDMIVVAAGYGSGVVKVWHSPRGSKPAGSQGATRSSSFVPNAPIAGSHASRVTYLGILKGSDRHVDPILLSVDGYGRSVSHLIPRLVGSAWSVAAMMSSGGYSQSIASLSSNIYSSMSSVLRGTSLGGDGLSSSSASASVVNATLMEEVGCVRRVVGSASRGAEDLVILLTEKAGVVVAKVGDGGKVVVDTVVGYGWGHGGDDENHVADGDIESTEDETRDCLDDTISHKDVEDSEPRKHGDGGEGHGEVVAACLRDEHHTLLAMFETDAAQVWVRNVEQGVVTSIKCPGVVQDVVFLHKGMFVAVVHYDASGKTLLTLVPTAGDFFGTTTEVSEISVAPDESTAAYACTDLYDIYVKGSAVGGDGSSDVMLLTSASGVRCVQLMSWKQKLSSMVAAKRFGDALLHAALLYADSGDHVKHGWPANDAQDATAVSKQVMSLLVLFIQQAMGDENMTMEEESARHLARLALDTCSLVSEFSAFYGDLPALFQRAEVAWNAYLDVVLDHCREASMISGNVSVPPQIIQSLVERVSSSSGQPDNLELLEDVLLSFDVSSLDLNQVLPLCIKYGLYSVLIYVFTRGMKDFKSPASLLLAKAAAEPAHSEARHALVMRLLVYVYACFEGLWYPLGSGDVLVDQSDDSKTMMRLEMMDFLLFATVAEIREAVGLWESLIGTTGDHGQALEHLEGYSCPVLAFLCEVDAATTLGLLQNLLSGWDGLESDLGPSRRDSTQRAAGADGVDGTLSQATVNRVVSFLDDGDGDSNSAKLAFVAELISSNRASLPPKATSSVLAFLCRQLSDTDGDDVEGGRKHDLLNNFVEIVKHAPAEELGDDTLDLARTVGSAAAEAEILIKRGAYRDAISCLVGSKTDAMRIFVCYRDISGRGGDTAAAFQEAILPFFPTLVEIDARATAEIAVDLAGHQHEVILESFEKDSNAQFRFLNAVVALLRERGQGGPEGGLETSPWITLLRSKAMSNMYIRLMCRFDPDSVLGYLQTAEYDVDECLECCRANGLRAAQAFLLDKTGDLDAAFGIYLEEIETINSEMVASSSSDACEEVISRGKAARDAAVSLCSRLRTPAATPGGMEQGEQPDPKFKLMMTAYVHSYVTNRKTVPAWVKTELTSHIGHVAQRAGHTEALVKHVVETFQDVPTGDIRDVLTLLFGICASEARKLDLAVTIAQKDVGVALSRAYRKQLLGRPA